MYPTLTEQTRDILTRPFQMLIDGQWTSAASEETIDVVNPADELVIAKIPAGGSDDVDRAVAAARRAFETGPWAKMTPGERSKLLWRIADLLEARQGEFAELETLDNGKPITMSKWVDIPASVSALRYWAGWCTKIAGETRAVDMPGDYIAMTLREPVGVVGLITPWNFPLMSAVSKLGPALAEHDGVDKISFTGSTAVGKSLIGAARGNLKRLTLELGGKSPTIILPDADLEKAIVGAGNAIFRNSGQICVAGSRLYVARQHFDQVIEGVSNFAAQFQLGNGLDPATTMGPLVSGQQRERVSAYIDGARGGGATVIAGDAAVGDKGFFVRPTIIHDIDQRAPAMQEEIFGPVLVASAVDELDELAALANDSIYGLSASIWTRDISAAYKLAKKIRAGTITINSGSVAGPNIPFGGFKQSGWGRENGADGIESFTELKTVITAL